MSDEANTPADPAEMTDEQLDAILADAPVTVEGDLDGKPLEFEPMAADGDPEPDKEEGEGEEEGEDDSASTSKDEETSDSVAEKDEKDEDSSDDEDGDGLDLPPDTRAAMEKLLQRIEIQETTHERLQAELTRANLLRDRQAGRAGALKQQLEQRGRDGDASDGEVDDSDEARENRPTESKSELDDALSEIRVEKVERALTDASRAFYTENETFFSALEQEVGNEAASQFGADLVAKVKEHQETLGEDLFSMSPKMAKQVSATILSSAFADMKLDLLRDLRSEASEQAEKSRREIRARKKDAAGARSNKSAAVSGSNAKAKRPSDMTDAELEVALKEAASLLE